MSKIMQESSQANELLIPSEIILFKAVFLFQYFFGIACDGIVQQGRDMHHAKRVFEAGMHGAWVNIVRPS